MHWWLRFLDSVLALGSAPWTAGTSSRRPLYKRANREGSILECPCRKIFGKSAVSEVGSSEVIEDAVQFFTRLDTMLAL
jgi:hypothetical protein